MVVAADMEGPTVLYTVGVCVTGFCFIADAGCSFLHLSAVVTVAVMFLLGFPRLLENPGKSS